MRHLPGRDPAHCWRDPLPDRAKACRHLAEVYGRAGRWTNAAHNLLRAIREETDAKPRSELYASLARVLRDRLKEPVLACS